MNYFIYSSLINGIIFTLLGIFVYLKNPKKLVNKVYFLFSLCVMEWAFAYFFWLTLGKDKESGLFWTRALNVGPTLIPVFYFHYILALFGWVEIKKRILIFSYICAGIFFLTSFTPLYIRGVTQRSFFPYWPLPGILHPFFLILFFGLPIYTYILMLRFYPKASAIQRSQIKYVLISSILGFGGGGSNYLLFYGIPFPPYLNIGGSIFPIMLAYAIIRYRLMEIDTVIHKTLLWALTSASVLIPIGVLLYFVRPWLESLRLFNLTLMVTGLFYLFLYYFSSIQPKIDHFFRRKKYDYYQALAQIPQHIGSELDIKAIINRLFKELKQVLYIKNCLILIEEPENLTHAPSYREAGSIGYDTLSNKEGREDAVITKDAKLASWLLLRKKALEREQV